MQVAADSAHEENAFGFDGAVLGGEQRFEHGHACFHGARSDQDFRNVEDVVLEILPDDAHAGDQSLIDDFLHGAAFGESFLREPVYLIGVSLVQVLIHQGVVRHPSSA